VPVLSDVTPHPMSNISSRKWLIGRRHALKGLGALVALPFLDCMRAMRGFAEQTVRRPRRCAFVYIPNGVNTIDFQIQESGAGYALSKALEPLAGVRESFTPVSGLFHPNGLGFHHGCQKIWLTGGKLGPSDRNSVSLDQLVAARTGEETRYPSIELSGDGSTLAWTQDGIALPSERSPGVVFKRLFEAPAGGLEKQRRSLARKASILDLVSEDAKRLEARLGTSDRDRLDQYLTSLREVEVRTERSTRWLETPLPTVSAQERARVDKAANQQLVGEYFRAMYDLVALAFQTDMTRVATFSSGSEGQGLAIPEIQIKQDRHSLSHHNGNPKRMEELTASDRFNVEQFRYFLERLSSVSDNEGPLIETTVGLFGSGMSYGHSHGNANLPILVAGGTKLGFRHGAHLDLNRAAGLDAYRLDNPREHYKICFNPVNPKARMSNLLLTIAQSMGVETARFADSTGTLQELRA
jgi:hypothetical protein